MQSKVENILKELSLEPGVSGFEDRIRKKILDIATEIGLKMKSNVDPLGNLVLSMGSEGPSVALMAHMDEVGIIVRYIDEHGFLGIDTVGGIDTRVMIGRPVVIYGSKGPVYGTIGVKPIHLLSEEEKRKVPEARMLFVDIGVNSKEDAKKLVEIGDVGHLMKIYRKMPNEEGDIVSCGAFDDRTGCATLLLATSLLKESEMKCRLNLVFTVQEEVGLRGSRVAAYNLRPDIVIAVDVTHAVGYPGLQPKDFTEIYLGKGPAIEYGPPVNWRLARLLMRIAEENNIPYQASYLRGRSGTDIDEAQIARSGAIAGVVSIPLRYMHTPIETVSLKDIERTAELLALFIKSVDEKSYKELKPS